MEHFNKIAGNIKFSLNKRALLLLIISVLTMYTFISIVSENIYFNRFISGYLTKDHELKIIEENITSEALGNKLVTKVIDGDTIILEGGYVVRLLGIDADEQGYPCYDDAKKRLEELILNKEIYLEADKKNMDEFKRYLRYVIINGENVNIKLVREGLAIARISEEVSKYKDDIIQAEKEAIKNKIGCKWKDITNIENTIASEIKLTTTIEKNEEKITIVTINKVSTTTLLIETTRRATTTTSTIKEENINLGEEIDACDAINYINEEKIVVGKVVSTSRSKTNTIFLNFGNPYPRQCFTAVIFSYYLSKFPEKPEKYYYGKLVRIRGNITEYQGKPQIILKDQKQIEIIE